VFDIEKEICKLQKMNFGKRNWDNNAPYVYWRTQITHSRNGFTVNIHTDGFTGCKAKGQTLEEAWKNGLIELEKSIQRFNRK